MPPIKVLYKKRLCTVGRTRLMIELCDDAGKVLAWVPVEDPELDFTPNLTERLETP
jgi:hypothetical protein